MATQTGLAPSTGGPAIDQVGILAQLRRGLVVSLFILAALFLGTACYPFLRGLPFREGWPWTIWGGLLGAASLAGGLWLLTRKPTSESADLQTLRNFTALALVVLSLGFAAVPVYAVSKNPLSLAITPVAFWAVALSIIGMTMALVTVSTAEGRRSDLDRYRLCLLTVGGLAGFVTALLGCILPVSTYQTELMGGLESWRSEPGAILFPGAALLGGLLLMFISLQLAQGMERTDATMRRLVYGYNAVLTSLLLLAVLTLPNVLSFAEPFSRWFGKAYDWTGSGFHSLSPATENLMADLKDPVRVYVLAPAGHPVTRDVQTMLEACKVRTSALKWELIDPNLPDNDTRIGELISKYGLTNPVGLLVTTGDESKKDNEFVRFNELFQQEARGRGDRAGYTFTGEAALVNAINNLTESKATIYFTQGNGELSWNAPTDRQGQVNSISRMRGRLQERKTLEVKELKFDAATRKVPDDANVVVIARPTSPLPPSALEALRDYVKVRKGKLLVLLEPTTQTQGDKKTLVHTGLEELLAESGVQVGDDVILSLLQRQPLLVAAEANPASTTSVAAAFSQTRTLFPFFRTRTVAPAAETRGMRVEPLLVAKAGQGVVVDKDMNRDPFAYRMELLKNREAQIKALATKDVSVAVTVAETSGAGGMPQDAAHAGQFKETPRMAVFGSANWVSDANMEEGASSEAELFSSCLSWLRDRPDVGKRSQGKERPIYELNVLPDSQTRLRFLPLGLIILGVVGLGMGVWVVRRR